MRIREIRGLDILTHKGGIVSYHDPYIPNVKTNEGRKFNSVDLSADMSSETSVKGEALMNADVVVLTTNHKDFDIEFIKKHANLMVDLRNMVEEKGGNVFKL